MEYSKIPFQTVEDFFVALNINEYRSFPNLILDLMFYK